MLTAAQILRILAAQLDADHGETAIDPGHHAINADVLLGLSGSVQQCPRQTIKATARIPMLPAWALVCERAGISSNQMAELFVEAAVEASLTDGELAGNWIASADAAERRAKELIVARLPKVERSGPLRRILEINKVQVAHR